MVNDAVAYSTGQAGGSTGLSDTLPRKDRDALSQRRGKKAIYDILHRPPNVGWAFVPCLVTFVPRIETEAQREPFHCESGVAQDAPQLLSRVLAKVPRIRTIRANSLERVPTYQ